jgi:hypothetical protein
MKRARDIFRSILKAKVARGCLRTSSRGITEAEFRNMYIHMVRELCMCLCACVCWPPPSHCCSPALRRSGRLVRPRSRARLLLRPCISASRYRRRVWPSLGTSAVEQLCSMLFALRSWRCSVILPVGLLLWPLLLPSCSRAPPLAALRWWSWEPCRTQAAECLYREKCVCVSVCVRLFVCLNLCLDSCLPKS